MDTQLQISGSLYLRVRAGFVSKGTTLNAWCQKHGIVRQYATICLHFRTNGPAARKIRRRLARAAGVRIGR